MMIADANILDVLFSKKKNSISINHPQSAKTTEI